MKKIRVINTAGARPNFMKIAPLVRAFNRYPEIEHHLVHTGQHYDDNLSLIFFRDLGIPKPDTNLGVGSGSREEQIARIEQGFEVVTEQYRPDVIIVVGDVNSTVACARVGKRRGIAVAHVEAGLRSFDASMPEEHNRRETDLLADLLFVTEQAGMDNLQREAVPGKRFFVGNVMIDTLVYSLPQIRESAILEKLELRPQQFGVCTFHRPSNVDAQHDLAAVLETLAALAARLPLVLPLHPRTKASLEKHGLTRMLRSIENLILTEPLGYMDFMRLVLDSQVTVTDSGGVQEETSWLGVPCITVRENTERPATVEIGTNAVVGKEPQGVFAEFEKVMNGSFKKGGQIPLWDGKAAERIAQIIVNEC